jgi:hypothetical protein
VDLIADYTDARDLAGVVGCHGVTDAPAALKPVRKTVRLSPSPVP